MDEAYIVYADEEDARGDGIWGIFSSWENAEKALALYGLRPWDSEEHDADDPELETPREPDERVIGTYWVDYRLSHADRDEEGA